VAHDAARAKTFIAENGLSYTFLEDHPGEKAIYKSYHVESYPTNIVIDRHGHITKYERGYIPMVTLSGIESAIKKALAE
jgi:peroxiredoxin